MLRFGELRFNTRAYMLVRAPHIIDKRLQRPHMEVARMLLRNSRTIIGISLIISLAAFGLFYSTAYAGDADGVIGDDNAYTFKQNHFEHTTQAYTLAGAANQAMAWPAANKGANGAVVAVTLGADGASQAFTTNAASASGANAGIVQAVNIGAQVNDGATTTITTTTKMLTPHATFAPKLVADGGTCASGAVANSAGTVTNNAHQIAGTVTITMSGGNLAAGDYELCYQALGGILRNGTQDIDVANAAHTPLNGNYKLVADGDACSANAVAATTTTAVDADTLRITMGAGADLPAATAYELCYDWGGALASGNTLPIDFTIGSSAGNILGQFANIQKIVADGGNCSSGQVANVASYTISDKDTIVITQGGGGALANGDYELCYDWGGIQAGGTSDLDPTGASASEPVLALATNQYTGLKLVADGGDHTASAIANTTTTKVDEDTVRVTMAAKSSAVQAYTSTAANTDGIVQPVNIGTQVNNGATTTITTTTKMIAAHAGGFPKLVADGGNCASGAVANSAATVTNNAHQVAGTVTITMSGGNLAVGDYELCYKTAGGILDTGTQDVDISGVTNLLNSQIQTPTYKLVADSGTCASNAVANSAVTRVDNNTVRITMTGGALAAATAGEICYTKGGLNNNTDYELIYTRGGISDAAVTNVDIAESVNTPLLTANGTFRVVADGGTCATAAAANTTTARVDADTVSITLAANQVLVPGAYEICYGYGKDPSKHFGWNWTNTGRTMKVTVGLNTDWANEVSAIEVFVNPASAETGETVAASKKPNATFRLGNDGFFPTGNQLDLLFTCDEKCSPGAISASTKVGIHVVKTTSGTSVDTFKSDNPTNTTELNAMANVGFKLDQTTVAAVAAPTPTPEPIATPAPELPKAGDVAPSNNLLIVTGLIGSLLIIMSSLFIFRRRAEARIK